MSTQFTGHALDVAPLGPLQEPPPWADLARRLHKAERRSRWLKYTVMFMAPVLIYVFLGQKFPEQFVRHEAVVAADRVQLFDQNGNPRMYMHVYSGVPVVQLIDESGVARLSLGLRYDNSPFISLSDVSGQTRALLQTGADNEPALQLFDEKGEPSFSVN
jgi:hypothetical protein